MTLAEKNPKIHTKPLLDLEERDPKLGRKVVNVLHKCPEADVPVLMDLLETTPQMATDKLGDIMAQMPKRHFERMLLPVAKVWSPFPCSCGRALVVVFVFWYVCSVRLRLCGGVLSVVSVSGVGVCARAEECLRLGEWHPSAGTFALRRQLLVRHCVSAFSSSFLGHPSSGVCVCVFASSYNLPVPLWPLWRRWRV